MRTVEPLGEPNPDPLGLPDMALMLSDVLVAFDHLKHTITVLANVYADEGARARLRRGREAIAEVRGALAGPVPRAGAAAAGAPAPEFALEHAARGVRGDGRADRRVRPRGRRLPGRPLPALVGAGPVEAFSIYRGLRAVNPSPYMYFLDFGDFEIAGASPEPLLTVTGRHVSTRPIAGTRPRGGDAPRTRAHRRGAPRRREGARGARDARRPRAQRPRPGLRVRHGRASTRFMAVETYSHVMHIVSNVSGTLRPEVGALDALRSVLPAGTLSGAPKVRAMEIIDELEPVKRGGYGGAIGYLSYTGDLDTCIHIRTVVVKDGVAHVQAGGGTVADAQPAYEYEESERRRARCSRRSSSRSEQPDWP